MALFTATASYYDRIYAFKDYRGEVERLVDIIDPHRRREGKRLLDVACGTGCHLRHLSERFHVEGLDLSPELLEIARKRNPHVTFHLADMLSFDLGTRFDLVTCLFSSLGYVKTLENAARAIRCMARHLHPDGLLVIEPWFTPGSWRPGTVHLVVVDEPDLKIARMNTSMVRDRFSYFDLHYLIGTPQGTEHVVEHHEMGLFETDEIRATMEDAGLKVVYDPAGLTGRGLFLGRMA